MPLIPFGRALRRERLAAARPADLVAPGARDFEHFEPTYDTGARLGLGLLGFLLAVTFVIALMPFRFEAPDGVPLAVTSDVRGVFAGIVLFLPLGFLFRLVRRARHEPQWAAVLFGLGVSVVIQFVQMFEPQRLATLSDIGANGLGTWIGVLLHDRLARHVRFSARTVGRLGLELPLMGLVYLLVPLLWLEGLVGGTPIEHFLRTVALGLFGASVLSSIQRHYFGPAHVLTPAGMTIGVAVWFLTGALPGASLGTFEYLVVAVCIVMALAYARSVDKYGILPLNRRFEGPALRTAMPLYALYLGVLAAPVRLDAISDWSFTLGFPAMLGYSGGGEWGRGAVLHLLEVIAAFTLLGYMVAELRGRIEESHADALQLSVLYCLPGVIAVEALQGLHTSSSASLAEAALLIAASAYGASTYRMLREHVRWLLSMTDTTRRQ